MFKSLKKNAALALVITILGATLAQAGWVRGPGTHTDVVSAGDTDQYTLVFRGGEYARVVVEGDGDTDLDLYIYDQNGRLVDYDSDDSDYCIASFTPAWTGTFTIRIVNRGAVWNRYTIRVN